MYHAPPLCYHDTARSEDVREGWEAVIGMGWPGWIRRRRARRVTRPLIAPDEPTCYTVTSSHLQPDGSTLVMVSCQAPIPWSGEIAWSRRVFTLGEWSGLSEDERAAAHAAVEAEVALLYRVAWRAHERDMLTHE